MKILENIVNFLPWLTLIFVVLKLLGYIDWSWLLVLMPTFLYMFWLIFLLTTWYWHKICVCIRKDKVEKGQHRPF